MADRPVNQTDAVSVFTWALNVLVQAQSGPGSGVGGEANVHQHLDLGMLKDVLVQIDNVENSLTYTLPGKVADARTVKALKDLADSLEANKVNVADIIDDFTTGGDDKVASAERMKILKGMVDTILTGQDLDPNKDVEVLAARASTVTGLSYSSIGDRMDGFDESYDRIASWSAKRFGLRMYTDTGEFERIGDAVGMVHRNHAGGYTEGIYSDFSFEDPWGGMKPCKMDSDGHILGWLGDPGYELIDGEEMVFIPRCYTGWTAKSVGGRPCMDIEVSPAPMSGLYPTGFVGSDGQLLRGLYLGRTKLGEESGSLVTKSGVAPKTNKSMTSFTTDLWAKSATAKWRMNDFAAWMLTTTLMAIEVGTFDVKTAIGPGIQSGMPYGSGSEYQAVAATTSANTITIADTVTNFYAGMVVQIGTAYSNNNIAANRTITDVTDNLDGTQTITVDGDPFSVAIGNSVVTWGQPVPVDQMDALHGESGYITQFESSVRSHVCWRWIWDLWGNVWELLGGILRVEGTFYISFNRDAHDDFSPVGNPDWVDTDYTPIVENGYQKEREVITYNNGQISLPKTTGGTGVGANTWYAAYLYYFGADYQTSTRVVLVSGFWSYGGYVSPFYWYGYSTPSDAYFIVGSRAVIEKEAA